MYVRPARKTREPPAPLDRPDLNRRTGDTFCPEQSINHDHIPQSQCLNQKAIINHFRQQSVDMCVHRNVNLCLADVNQRRVCVLYVCTGVD